MSAQSAARDHPATTGHPSEPHAKGIHRGVVNHLAQRRLEGGIKGLRFVIPHGKLARRVIQQALLDAGAVVDETVVYDTVRPDVPEALITKVLDAQPDLVCLTSASTAENLHGLLGSERIAQLAQSAAFIAIGPQTAQAAEIHGIPVALTAPQHDVPGLVAAVVGYLGAVGRRRSRERIDPAHPRWLYSLPLRAGVVKLADTHGSGPCASNGMEVQVLSPAP